ncbi:Rieske [2Fe-2S] iron-sulfur domain-containing protein [Aspergillus crustosus]
MSFPAVIALIAGLTFLYRVYNHRPTSTPKVFPSRETDPDAAAVSKESNYPEGYLTSPILFSLEHRAIFSKTWMALTHKSHLPTAGSYTTLPHPTAPLLLIKGKDNQIRAFHNVCRHRAYPVTRRESGKSTVLSCRYHGWSYNTRGELIKAPQFDGVVGFERSKNGLFGVGVDVDENGIVWVNLGVKGEGEGEESRILETGDIGNRAGSGKESVRVGGGVVDGGFNWKLALRKSYLVNALALESQREELPSPLRSILHYFQRKPESTHLFPCAFVFTIPSSNSWLLLNFLPSSETATSVRYELYSQDIKKSEELKPLLTDLETKVKAIVSNLEAEYKSSIKASGDPTSIFSCFDQTSLETQTQILSLLKAHTKLEKSHGGEIYPARREPRMNTKYEQAEQRACLIYLSPLPGHPIRGCLFRGTLL